MEQNRLISSQRIGESTRDFLLNVKSGSLSSTLYDAPRDSSLLQNAGLNILNFGNLDTVSPDKIDRSQSLNRLNSAAELSNTTLFSRPDYEMRLHIKSYLGIYENTPTAFISTGNLGRSALDIPNKDIRDRIRTYKNTQQISQTNLGITTQDKDIVAQVGRLHKSLSRNERPQTQRNVVMGGYVTDSAVHNILSTSKGDRIALASPYLDDPKIAASLIEVKSRGVDVTVITSNPDTEVVESGIKTPGRDKLLSQLSESGVNVITPQKDDPLLLHTKALSIVRETGDSTLFIGSHNFTKAAREYRSLDMMLVLKNKNLASQLYDELTQQISEYGLTQWQGESTSMNRIERSMILMGTGSLYKVRQKTIHPMVYGADPNSLTQEQIKAQLSERMPYYPTSMGSKFFDKFIDSQLPIVSIYSDVYEARTGKAAPNAITQLDKEISNPGLGDTINRIFKTKIYSEGLGFIGSTVAATGRFIDWVLGSEEYSEEKKVRDGKYSGTIQKMFGLQYQSEDGPGVFENSLTSIYGLVSGAAKTLGFYISVELPFKYLKAKLEDDYINTLLSFDPEKPTSKAGKVFEEITKFRRNLVFGPTIGSAISEVMSDPSTTKANFTDIFYNKIFNSDRAKQDLSRVVKTHNGKLDTINFGDQLSIYSISVFARRFDSERFNAFVKPIFEAINPYKAGSQFNNLYDLALQSLGKTISEEPQLIFQPRDDNPSILEPIVKNLGVDRIVKIAKKYDELASIMPANIMYWSPAIRRTLNLEEFDPEKHTTIRDLMSFENAVKWVDNFYKRFGSFIQNPSRHISQVSSAWKGELNLISLEREFKNSALFEDIEKIPQLTKDTKDSIEALYKFQSDVYSQKVTELEDFLQDSRVVRYKEAIALQNKRLEQSSFRTIDTTFSITENSYKSYNSPESARIRSTKSLLAKVGFALIADSIADEYIFRSMGASLMTQVAAYKELNGEDGEIARFEFSGVLPKWTAIGIQGIVGIGAGFLLPEVRDIGTMPGGLSSSIEKIQNFRNQIASVRRVYSQQSPILKTGNILEYEKSAGNSYKKIQQISSEISSLKYRRTGLKFNTTAAIASGFAAGIAVKTGAFLIAAGLNWLHHKNDTGIKLSGEDALFSSYLENLTVNAIATNETRGDYANTAIGQILAEQFLKHSSNGNRVYSFASQLTSPFFQIPLVIKADTNTGRATVGIGLQLMPLTGLGVTPILPFSFLIQSPKENPHVALLSLIDKTQPQNLSLTDRLSWGIHSTINTLTLGNFIAYEKNSAYEAGLDFIAASTILGLGSSYLIDKIGKENETVRSVAKVTESALEFSNKSLKFIYSTPFLLGGATAKGIHRSFSSVKAGELTQNKIKAPDFLRKVAPYYLAFTMTRMLADPLGGYVGEDYRDPYTQVSATLSAGAIIGYALDKTGVFSSSTQLADDFHTVMEGTKYKNLDGYKKILGSWLPDISGSPKGYIKEIDGILTELASTQSKSKTSKTLVISKRLLGEMASPALWEQAVRSGSSKSSLEIVTKLSYGSIKSIGARISVAAIAIGTVKGLAFSVANLLSADQLNLMYSIPLLGPGLRLLAGVENKSDKLENLHFLGVQGAPSPQGIVGIVNKFVSTMSFGLLDLSKATGLYSDTPDPFLSTIGQYGLTFKSERIGNYLQYASAASDLSVTAYQLAAGRVSQDILVRATSILKLGKAKNIEQALAYIRGATPRRKNAVYSSYTDYELAAASTSSGISRELGLRQYRLKHASSQRASELLLDYLREGLVLGKVGNNTIPGYKTPNTKYEPFGFISHAAISFKKGIFGASKPTTPYNPEEEWYNWLQQTNQSNRKILPEFSSWNVSEMFSPAIKNLGWLSVPVAVFMINGLLLSASEVVGAIASVQSKNEIDDLLKSSNISQSKLATNPYKYSFTLGTLASSNTSTIFQIDKSNRHSNVYRLPLNVDDLSVELKVGKYEILKGINKQYTQLHKEFSKYLIEDYTKDLQSLIQEGISHKDGYIDSRLKFKERVEKSVSRILEKGFGQNLFTPDSDMNLYKAFTGSQTGLKEFVEQSRAIASDAIEDVLQQLDTKINKGIDSEDIYKTILTLNSRLEQNESFKSLTSRLQQPIIGKYDELAHQKAYYKLKDGQSVTADSTLDLENPVKLQYKTNTLSSSKKPWTEKALSSGIKSVRGVSSAFAHWVSTGKSLYELVESGSVLLGGNSQSQQLRQYAGEQFVTGAMYWGLASAIASGVQALGIKGLGGTALSIAGLLGLDYLKSHLTPIRKLENSLIKGLGSLIARPVESVARVFDTLKLGDPVRFVGNLIATPLSFIGSVVSAPIRTAFENITGPLIADQYLSMQKDSSVMQYLKAFLLPKSVYSNFEGSLGKRIWTGEREPWLYGNAGLIQRQRQLEKITAIGSGPTILKDELIHPFLNGSFSSSSERMFYDRYLESYSGTRILSSFGMHNYRISNSLKLALLRRQYHLDHFVTSAAIARPPKPEDNTISAFRLGITNTLLNIQRKNIDRNITSTLLDEIRHTSQSVNSFIKKSSLSLFEFLKPKASLPQWVTSLNNNYSSFTHKISRQYRTTKYLTEKRYINPLVKYISGHLPTLSLSIPKVNFNLSNIVNQAVGVTSWSVDIARQAYSISRNILKNTNQFIYDHTNKLSPSRQLVWDILSETGQSAKKAFSNWSDSAIAYSKHWYSSLKSIKSETLKQVPSFSFKGWGSYFKQQFNTTSWNKPNIPKINTDNNYIWAKAKYQYNRIPVGVLSQVGLFTSSLMTSILQDNRLNNLNRSSSYREYERAYEETTIGLVGSVVGGAVALASKSPLAGLVGAIAGSMFLAKPISDRLSRDAYKNQDSYNPVLEKINQMFTVGTLLNIMQAPRLFNVAKTFGLTEAVKRGLVNYGASILTSGFGPNTSFLLANTLSDIYHQPKHVVNTTRNLLNVGKELPSLLKYLWDGSMSSQMIAASHKSSGELIDLMKRHTNVTSLDNISIKFEGTRFGLGGEFNNRTSIIQLSKSVQNVLGRSQLNRFVRGTSVSKAKFTALHEIAHAVDMKPGVSHLGLNELKELAERQSVDYKRLRSIVTNLSEQSTAKAIASGYGKDLIRQIFDEELSANVRALQVFSENKLGNFNQLIDLLEIDSRTKNEYKNLFDLADEFSTAKDNGIRYRNGVYRKLTWDITRLPNALWNAVRTPSSKWTGNNYTIKGIQNRLVEGLNLSTIKEGMDLFGENISHIKIPIIKSSIRSFYAGYGAYTTSQAILSNTKLLTQNLLKEGYGVLSYSNKVFGNIFNPKLAKLGLTVRDVLDTSFTVLDLWMSQESITQYDNINKKIKNRYYSNKTFLKKDINTATALQLGSLFGNVMGTAANFSTNKLIYKLASGLIPTLAGYSSFFGISNLLVNRQYEEAMQGHALYDPIQSSGFYLRTHRSFASSTSATILALEPSRRLLSKVVNKSLNFSLKALDFSVNTLFKGISLLSSLIASSSIASLSTIFGIKNKWLIPGILQSTKLITKTGSFAFSQISKLSSLLSSNILTYGNKVFGRVNKLVKPLIGLSTNTVTLLGVYSKKILNLIPTNIPIHELLRTMSGLRDRYSDTYKYLAFSSKTMWNKVRSIEPDLSIFKWAKDKIVDSSKAIYNTSKQILESIPKLSINISKLNQILYSHTRSTSRFVHSFIGKTIDIGNDVFNYSKNLISKIHFREMNFSINTSLVFNFFKNAYNLGHKLIKRTASYGVSLLKVATQQSTKFARFTFLNSYNFSKNLGRSVFKKEYLSLAQDFIHNNLHKTFEWLKEPVGFVLGKTQSFVTQSFELSKALGKDLLSTANDYRRLISESNLASKVIEYSKLGLSKAGKFADLVLEKSNSLIKKVSPLTSKISRATTSLFSKIGGIATKNLDKYTKFLHRHSSKAGFYVLSVGYKETFINAISPAIDLFTFASGSFKALSLNSHSTLADVESSYIQSAGGRGSLVGSVFGMYAFGSVGDMIGSLFGQLHYEDQARNKAKVRFDARDYGLVPVLEDMVQPLIRDTAIAYHAGRYAGNLTTTFTSSLATQAAQRITSGSLRVGDRAINALASGYKTGLDKTTSEAAKRFTRVLGHTPGANTLSKMFSGASGIIGKFAVGASKVLGPAIDVTRLAYGSYQATQARTEAEYNVAFGRTTGAIGSVAGTLIGGALGGPIGAIAGSIVGDMLGSAIGSHLGKEAYRTKTSGKRIIAGQLIGATLGVGLAALGAIALGLTAPVSLTVIGLGLLGGAIIGGFASLKRIDSKEVLEKNQKQIETTQQYLHYSPPTIRDKDEEDRKDLQLIAESKYYRSTNLFSQAWEKLSYGVGSLSRKVLNTVSSQIKALYDSTAKVMQRAGTLAEKLERKVQQTVSTVGTTVRTVGATVGNVINNVAVAFTNNSNLDAKTKALLDVIGYTEGTNNRYDMGFGGRTISLDRHPMTVWQGSSASGRYQFMDYTWRRLQKQYGYKDFSPETQDRAAIKLMEGRGVPKLLQEGRIQEAIYAASWEWASMPGPDGYSRYMFKGRKQPVKKMSDILRLYNERLAFYNSQSASTSNSTEITSQLPSESNKSYSLGAYKIKSLGGREFGERFITEPKQLVPHWRGTGGYTRYRKDEHGHNQSYLSNGLRVVDLKLMKNGSDNVLVPSPVEGKIVQAGFNKSGLGIISIADSSGTVHRILHNKTIDVKVGQTVHYGQSLGLQGSTGPTSTTVHVHLETTQAVLNRYIKSLNTGNFGKQQIANTTSDRNLQQSQSPVQPTVQPTSSKPYMRLIKVGKKDDKGLEQLKLQLIDKHGKVADSINVTSGDPTKQVFQNNGQSIADLKYPIESGVYTILQPRWIGNIGDYSKDGGPGGPVFLPISPKFQTNRSRLGIHWDADRDKVPGTAGCIGSVTLEEIKKVVAWRNSGVDELRVYTTSPPPSNQISQSTDKLNDRIQKINKNQIQSFYVKRISDGKIISQYNSNHHPNSPASTIKLLIANALIDQVNNKQISLNQNLKLNKEDISEYDKRKPGYELSVRQALKLMLENSDNTATNMIISALGGVDKVNYLFQKSGYTQSSLRNKLSIPNSKLQFSNKATAKDVSESLYNIYTNNSEAASVAKKALSSTRNFNYEGEIGGKIGNNSKVIGNVGLVNAGSENYIITIFSNQDGNKQSSRSTIKNSTNSIRSILIDKNSTSDSEKIKPLTQNFNSTSTPKPTYTTKLIHSNTGASFYGLGDGFHGKPTASGEKFNTYAMTAAHKKLPLGSMVLVTSISDPSKQVIVRINDRGPYIKGRDIDLSTAAMKALGGVDKGHIQVKVELITGGNAKAGIPISKQTTNEAIRNPSVPSGIVSPGNKTSTRPPAATWGIASANAPWYRSIIKNAGFHELNVGNSGFGMRLHPIKGFWRMHDGLDITGNVGRNFYSPFERAIFKAEKAGGYGLLASAEEIDAQGNKTGRVVRVGHLSKFGSFKNGQIVSGGSIIGHLGSTGGSTGPHFHIEETMNGKFLPISKELLLASLKPGKGVSSGQTTEVQSVGGLSTVIESVGEVTKEVGGAIASGVKEVTRQFTGGFLGLWELIYGSFKSVGVIPPERQKRKRAYLNKQSTASFNNQQSSTIVDNNFIREAINNSNNTDIQIAERAIATLRLNISNAHAYIYANQQRSHKIKVNTVSKPINSVMLDTTSHSCKSNCLVAEVDYQDGKIQVKVSDKNRIVKDYSLIEGILGVSSYSHLDSGFC